MRLGLALFSAAAVIGGYGLVNSISGRPTSPGVEAPVAVERDWLPSRLGGEPAPETRSYELIRYVNRDGSFGMVDDPTRVPPGATITGRERKTVTIAEPAPRADADPAFGDEMEEEERLVRMLEQRQASNRRLVEVQRRVAEVMLGSAGFGADGRLAEVQKDLDEMQREADRMNDCADGDCPEVGPPNGALRTARPH